MYYPGYYPASPVSVFGVKVNGSENSTAITVGPTVQWGLNSFSKTNQWNELQGDFSSAPMLYGAILDNDLYDTPFVDLWPY